MIKEMKEPWGESILLEHKELKEKYSSLINYINSEDFCKLSSNIKKIITNLKVLMESYISNLTLLLYEDVDNMFIQDYSMLGLLLSTFTSGFSSPSNINFASTTSKSNELIDSIPIKE